MVKKIYIMGCPGSGKTTLARKLAREYKISFYELDKIVWDDDNHVKREKDDISNRFHKILRKKSWIIEDVGRNSFIDGRVEADIIYYIKISKIRAYCRILKRWIRQKIGKEEYSYPPSLRQLFYYLSIVHSYFKKKKKKLKELESYPDKVRYLSTKDLKYFSTTKKSMI